MVGQRDGAGTPRTRTPRAGWRRAAGIGYGAAVALVLLLAAALRFHDLAERSFTYDEAVVTLSSAGAFSEILGNTRAYGTAPILFPIALWAVQQVAATDFSVRFLSAASSLLTVAILLLVLPRVGLGRAPAFFAGWLAAMSVLAIAEARDMLVYSADAFVAALLLAALLRFVREGRGGLLGATLFVAPLVQYGLGLFGAAVLLAAAFCLPPARPAERASTAAPVARRFRRRLRLLPYACCLAAGGVLTVALTFRHQFEPGKTIRMGHLPDYYLRGGITDPGAALSFVFARGWDLLGALLSEPVAAAALGSPAFLVLAAAWRGRRSLFRRRPAGASSDSGPGPGGGKPSPGERPSAERIVLTLAVASLALAVAAALARLYPLGAIRQLLYLGPIVFTAAGVLSWSVVRRFAAALPRGGREFLVAAVAAALLFSGARAVARADLYSPTARMEAILDALEDAGPGDLVYVSGSATPQIRWYHADGAAAEGDSAAYHYGREGCYRDFGPCLDELTALPLLRTEPPARIWIVHINGEHVRATRRERGEFFPLREAARGSGDSTLFLIPDTVELAALARRERWRVLAAPLGPEWADFEGSPLEGPPLEGNGLDRTPAVRGRFAVHRAAGGLVYAREPCAPADVAGGFFLRLHPAAGGERRSVERRDFDFSERGVRVDGKCLAAVPFDPGEYGTIWTGQFASGATPAWETALRRDPGRSGSLRESVASGAPGEPAARADFDLYLDGPDLLYHRRPCPPEAVAARFFLHLFPPADPARGGRWSFENRDFSFEERGLRLGDECLALAPLPAEGVAALRTGQWVGGEPPLWQAALRLDRERFVSRLAEIASGASGEPAARSTFDLYFGESGLAYHRAPCAPADLEAPFFLHLTPRDRVPREERGGFGTRRFEFAQRGVRIGSECLALFPLDPRGIAALVTGQEDEGTALWRAGLRFGPDDLPDELPDALPVGSALPAADLRALAGPGEPAARSVFDLFFDGTTITYFKEPCVAADLEARFFLHFVPEDPADLPGGAGSGSSGSGNPESSSGTVRFENRDFPFPEYGLRLDGQCLARVPAPDYAIDRIVTGQFVSDRGRLWQATLPPRE